MSHVITIAGLALVLLAWKFIEKIGDHIAWIGPIMLLVLICVVTYHLS